MTRSSRLSRCFNPRPREGATSSASRGRRWTQVSIHAPAKGRLAYWLCQEGQLRVSIHAPAKGRQAARPHPLGCGFNPRPREGATAAASLASGPRVSIHAPAEGRPEHDDPPRSMHPVFQSTPPRRGDAIAPCAEPTCRFQSTPPRRGDRASAERPMAASSFNPRPREGATLSSSALHLAW